MKTLLAVVFVLGGIITLPIWLFLVYEMLQATHADRLEWFLFWVYVPVSLVTNGAVGMLKWMEKK